MEFDDSSVYQVAGCLIYYQLASLKSFSNAAAAGSGTSWWDDDAPPPKKFDGSFRKGKSTQQLIEEAGRVTVLNLEEGRPLL